MAMAWSSGRCALQGARSVYGGASGDISGHTPHITWSMFVGVYMLSRHLWVPFLFTGQDSDGGGYGPGSVADARCREPVGVWRGV